MELKFKIKDDRLIPGGVMGINTGSLNVYTCDFEIPERGDFVWICVFKQADEAYQQVIENGKCYIPNEVMNKPGTIKVGCYGIDGEKRISTNWLEFNISEGAYCQATAPEEPAHDLWESLVLNACPYIGENGNWYVYDKENKEYKDSGKPARGKQGEQGNTGQKGQDGYTPKRGVDYWTDEDKNEVTKSLENKLNFEERLGNITKNTGNSLKGYVVGNIVTISDISPVDHTIGTKVTSKNLINIEMPLKLVSASAEAKENKLLITRTNTYESFSNVFFQIGEYCDFINETLTVSIKNESPEPWIMHICGFDKNNNYISGSEILSEMLNGNSKVSKTLTVPEKYNIAKLVLRIQSKDNAIATDEVYTFSDVQVEKGGKATDYTPYASMENVVIRRYGGNLVDINNPEKLVNCSVSTHGRDICIKKTNLEAGFANIYYSLGKLSHFAGRKVTMSATNKSDTSWTFYIGGLSAGGDWIDHSDVSRFGKIFAAGIKDALTLVVPEIPGAEMLCVRICSENNSIATDNEYVLSDIQVGLGDTVSEYTTYTKPLEIVSETDGTTYIVPSVYPSTTLVADKKGSVIECKYNRDINKAYEELTNAIISLGGNV